MSAIAKPNVKETESLLRDLASEFVEEPSALVIANQAALDGSVYWAMQGAPRDDGQLVGQAGHHVHALTFVITQIGVAVGSDYTFRLLTLHQAVRTAREPRDTLSFDTSKHVKLLRRLVEALALPMNSLRVDAGSGARTSLTFAFTVGVSNLADYAEWVRPRKIILAHATDRSPERSVQLSVVEALGCLFRAIAQKHGVRYQLNVTKP